MISGGLLLGSDPKSKICTTSSHTRCSCSALGYLDVLEQLGRSCIVVSRLVLFLSEDEERDWEADATPQFSSDSWKVGNFPCDEEFQRVCNSVRMQTITWKLVLFFLGRNQML
jgi:hypothetical protein